MLGQDKGPQGVSVLLDAVAVAAYPAFMSHRRGVLVVTSIVFILIVFSAFALHLFNRPGILLVVDKQYRETYGSSRANRALMRARLSLWRPVEELLLDETARPDMITALIDSRSSRPALVAFGFWLSTYAEALHANPDAPAVVLLGGETPHAQIPGLPVDRNDAYRALAKRCEHIVKEEAGPVLLIANSEYGETLLKLMREESPFLAQAQRLVLFDSSGGASSTVPSAVILAGGRLSSWPDSWNGLPFAIETIVPSRYFTDDLFALMDSSIYCALPYLGNFDGESRALSYPVRLEKPRYDGK